MKEHEIEELLRRANPEPEVDALRMKPDMVQVRSASVLDRRDPVRAQYQQHLRTAEAPRASRSGVLSFAIAAGAAALVLVVIAGVALLSVNGGVNVAPAGPIVPNVTQPTTVPDQTPPTTTGGDIPSTTVAASDVALPQPWVAMERVTDGFWFEGGWVTSVVVGGPGVVAVGATDGWPFTDAAVWTSPDGHTWSRVDEGADVFGDESTAGDVEGSQIISDVAVGRSGIIAVGVDGRRSDYDAAVWVSVDGEEWERVPHDEAIFGGSGIQAAYSVVQFDNTVIAVGESAGRAQVWVSYDGREWARASVVDAPGGDKTEPTAMSDVAVWEHGLVAVGSAGSRSRPAVWLSSNGITWNRLPEYLGAGSSGVEGGETAGGSMTLVAARETGLVAIGKSKAGPIVWASVDGFAWHKLDATFIDVPVATRASIAEVVWDGDRLIAVGGYEGKDPGWCPCVAVIWVSLDGGRTWHVGGEQPVDTGAAGISDTQLTTSSGATHLTRYGSQYVVVGNDSIPTDEAINGYIQHTRTLAVWITTMTNS